MRPRRVLATTRGLKMDAAHQGTLAIGRLSAHVALEADNLIQVRMEPPEPNVPTSQREALCATHRWPGNARYAVWRKRLIVVADMRIDDAESPESFRYTVHALRIAANNQVRRPSRGEPIDPGQVDNALTASTFDAAAIVRLERGWELRPRVPRGPVAVQMAIDGDELHFHRELLSNVDEIGHSEALVHQVLRFNAQLRQCRLALRSDARIVAETRVRSALLNPRSLSSAARAVAVASEHCQATLEILARRPEVAREYQTLFLNG
jgi:hypothetical protein